MVIVYHHSLIHAMKYTEDIKHSTIYTYYKKSETKYNIPFIYNYR